MEYILSLSYGKDSLACLGAIAELGWQLDRIIHAEIWATETIPADLPPNKDSPITFKPDHAVHDFDKRFQLEDLNIIIPNDRRFRWKCLNDHTFN